MDIIEFNEAYIPTILETARQHYHNEEYGKCCSYYLLLFHYDISYCHSLKDEFISAVCKWLKRLIILKRLGEVLSFIQTSMDICLPIKIDIVLASSQTLFTSGYIFESAKLLGSCHENKIISYTLEENIEQLYNMLIGRWHFRMLNDKKRNSAYTSALTKAFQRGHRKVLDIGSGTGIFSLIAFKLGFEMICSCEVSDVMCDIQKKCIDSNRAGNSIHLINKLSTDMEIGKDFHEKPTLVITEIFDCGLLGEGVLPVLINSWDKLLDVQHGEVIPHSAVVYGVCIECEEIRKHNRYQVANGCILYGCKDPGDEKKQPYTTEYMAGIKGGYRKLSNQFLVKSFNFNLVSELKEMIGKSENIEVPIISNGILDAIMVYFSLHVDSSIEVNTLDEDGLCWEQAIYNIPYHREMKPGDNVLLDVYCGEEHLGIKVLDAKDYQSGKHIDNYVQSESHEMNIKYETSSISNNIYTINRCLVARLNDKIYIEKYKSAILYHVNRLKVTHTTELNICFICSEITILPLFLSQFDSVIVHLIDPSDKLLELLQHDISIHRLKCISRPLFNELPLSKTIFDLVISEPIECNGLIMESYIMDLSAIKLFACSDNTVFLPSDISLYGCCITSDRLLHENRVLKNNIPFSLNIGDFINEYRVVTHPDIDGNNLTNSMLSEKYLLQHIDLRNKLGAETVESFKLDQSNIDITFTRCGTLTGLLYWFDVVLYGDERICSAPSENTHWRQACIIFPQQNFVNTDDKVTLTVTRNISNFHFQIC